MMGVGETLENMDSSGILNTTGKYTYLSQLHTVILGPLDYIQRNFLKILLGLAPPWFCS